MEDMGCPYSCFALSAPIRDVGGGGCHTGVEAGL